MIQYEILDHESGDSLAIFPTEDQARAYLSLCLQENPKESAALVVLYVDHGHVVKAFPAADYLVA